MIQSEGRAKRLLREMPDDPARLLTRRAYWKPPFLRLYFEHVDGLIFDNPQNALPWAKTAAKVALMVPEHEDHRAMLAMSHAICGGAFRSTHQLNRADKEYEKALKIADSGPISLDVRAEIKSRLAVLRACQKRFDESLALAQCAVDHFRSKEHAVNLGEALVRLGCVFGVTRRFEEAIPIYCEAIRLCQPKISARSGRTHHSAVHNLALATMNTTRLDVLRLGLAHVKAARKLLRDYRDGVPRHKLGWIEGVIFWRLNIYPRAFRALEVARRGFVRLALPYEIALVSIDLATAHCFLGDFGRAAAVAEDAFQHVQALESDEEGIAVVKVWLDAIRAGELDEEISTATRQMIESRIGPGGCCRSRKK